MKDGTGCLSLKPGVYRYTMLFSVYPLTGEPTVSSRALSKHSRRHCAISLLCERKVMSRSPPNEAKPLSTLRGQIATYSNTSGQQFLSTVQKRGVSTLPRSIYNGSLWGNQKSLTPGVHLSCVYRYAGCPQPGFHCTQLPLTFQSSDETGLMVPSSSLRSATTHGQF